MELENNEGTFQQENTKPKPTSKEQTFKIRAKKPDDLIP